MGHEHQRVRIFLQVPFQPVAGFQVEMVGRLVQQQQTRLLQQQPCQRDAHLPAAAELFARACPVVLREAEAVQNGSHPGLQGISSAQMKLLRQGRIALGCLLIIGSRMRHVGQLMLQPAAFLFQAAQLLKYRERLLEDGPATHKKPILREVAEAQLPRTDNSALIRCLQAGQHLHEGGFPCPVVPHQSDAIPLIDLKIQGAEEPITTKRLAEALDLQHDSLENYLV